jgi:MerC mercury resistance protein
MPTLSLAERSGDRKGILLAILCFVHCVAGPLLLSVAGFTSLVNVSEALEPVFTVSSLVFGMVALVPAYRKKHRRIVCLALFLGGLFCLVVLRHVRWALAPEVIVTGVGAALIVAAHALNLKLVRACQCWV